MRRFVGKINAQRILVGIDEGKTSFKGTECR